MRYISLLTIFLIFAVVIAQATDVPEEYKRSKGDVQKIGNHTYTQGVRFKDLYQKIANSLIKTHSQYNALFAEFNSKVVEAAKKDNLPPPEFFFTWNDNYKKLAKDAKEQYISFLASIRSFKKKLDKAKGK